MKSIKITAQKSEEIESALCAANGKSEAHTYTTYEELAEVVARAESQLSKILAKKDWKGAEFYSTSGSAVAKSYKYSRIATMIVLRRGSSDWFLDAVTATGIWADGGRESLILNENQDRAAVANLRTTYRISKN